MQNSKLRSSGVGGSLGMDCFLRMRFLKLKVKVLVESTARLSYQIAKTHYLD